MSSGGVDDAGQARLSRELRNLWIRHALPFLTAEQAELLRRSKECAWPAYSEYENWLYTGGLRNTMRFGIHCYLLPAPRSAGTSQEDRWRYWQSVANGLPDYFPLPSPEEWRLFNV